MALEMYTDFGVSAAPYADSHRRLLAVGTMTDAADGSNTWIRWRLCAPREGSCFVFDKAFARGAFRVVRARQDMMDGMSAPLSGLRARKITDGATRNARVEKEKYEKEDSVDSGPSKGECRHVFRVRASFFFAEYATLPYEKCLTAFSEGVALSLAQCVDRLPVECALLKDAYAKNGLIEKDSLLVMPCF